MKDRDVSPSFSVYSYFLYNANSMFDLGLRDDALKRARIPTELHPAVLSLDDNKTLPSMFHAARQVHFF